jgi:hypothetical protein
MTTRIKKFIYRSNVTILGLTLAGGLAASGMLLAADDNATKDSGHTLVAHESAAPAKLIETVRNATRQFMNVKTALDAGYQPFLGCVSGPNKGAMGIHYVNGALVGDNEIDATRPEALIYEPSPDGPKLVGVEFIVDAATWLALHDSPPVLEGQTFQFVDSPNRFGLNSFFELHVWAWRDNPDGAFVDWNTRVSCEGQ